MKHPEEYAEFPPREDLEQLSNPTREEFENHFKKWAREMSPNEADWPGLRVVAWEFFSWGHDKGLDIGMKQANASIGAMHMRKLRGW
jgi:hypothetical protein